MVSRCTRLLAAGLLILSGSLAVNCAGGMAGDSMSPPIWPEGIPSTFESISQQVATAVTPMGEMETTSIESMIVSIEAVGPRLFELTITGTGTETDAPEQERGETWDRNALVGLNSRIEVDRRGLIVEASNLEDNVSVSENEGPQVLTEQFQRFFVFLPDGQLKPGAEWNRDYSYAQTGTDFGLNFHYLDSYLCIEETLEQGEPVFVISLNTVMEMYGGSPEGRRSVSLSGDGKGTLVVEKDTGMLLNLESVVVLRGSFRAMEQETPVNLAITTNISRKPLPAGIRIP